MTEIERNINYAELEFKFKKRSIDIIQTKDISLPVETTKTLDYRTLKKPLDLTDGPAILKRKSK